MSHFLFCLDLSVIWVSLPVGVMVRDEEREDNGSEAGLLFIGTNYMWVMHYQTNTAFETTVLPPLSSNYSDLPLPPTTLIPHAVIYALAPLCLSALWDRFVQLMQSLLELGLNLHPMSANSSRKIIRSMLINFTCEGVEWRSCSI